MQKGQKSYVCGGEVIRICGENAIELLEKARLMNESHKGNSIV
jgi:hypothetical protein